MRVTPKHDVINNTSERGFSLVELLVALAIFGLVTGSIYSSFGTQNRIYHAQEKVAAIQQNLRAAMYILESEIRMAGYDSEGAGGFGITDCRANRIQFTQDDDSGGIITTTLELSGTNLQLNGGTLAQNIEAFGLAYAYDDNDNDEDLETDANGNIIWAVDTGTDDLLDLRLDTDGDGILEANADDDTDGNDIIDGDPLAQTVAATDIRAVRIWILGQSDPARPEGGHSDNNTYVVGRTIVNSPNDGLYRRMLTSIVKCRNMGVQ